MTGYKDMTFCPFYLKCIYANACERPLTPEVKEKAREWWGSDAAPICVFTSEPECYSDED
jgi:hypothetical protein